MKEIILYPFITPDTCGSERCHCSHGQQWSIILLRMLIKHVTILQEGFVASPVGLICWMVYHMRLRCIYKDWGSVVEMLEFSGLLGMRGEIHICHTTTKWVDWCKHVRNQYIQHCIYMKSCTATPKHMCLTVRRSHRISKFPTHPLERQALQARHPLKFTPP